ncbi:MAG: hypothetical protein ACREM3_18835, partial [Candidatus Rokuibacteriota bacterium]
MSDALPPTGRLAYLPGLTVDRNLFELRFERGCATWRCDATCCATGVSLDVRERDRVLAHADLVRGAMSPGQDPDPAHWFAAEEFDDADFPSGRATHTRAGATGCAFLDAERRCVLQKASLAAGGGLDLKPFFCTAFPITLSHGVLLVDDEEIRLRPRCCGSTGDGPLTVLDVCSMELEYMLGGEGVAALRLIGRRGERAAAPPDT